MFDVRYTNDIVLLIWMGIALFLSKDATKQKVTVLGQEEERYTLLFAVIVFYPVFWFVTTVFMRGDMYAYAAGFDQANMSVADVISKWNSIEKGPGYSLLVAFFKGLGVTNFQQFRVVMALLQSIPMVIVWWKCSEDYTYSVFLFVANMSYDSWMMNGMRQFLAASIVLIAFPFLVKKKYITVVVIVYAATLVHQSALVMVPVFLISQFKPWSKLNLLMLVVFAVVLYYYIHHSVWMTEESLQEAKGSNPIRIAISAIPTVLAFAGRKQIALANNRMVNICVNISAMTVVIYIVSSMTSGIMTGRLPGYTTVYNFLIFPYLLSKVFNEVMSKNIRLVVSLFYVLYFFADAFVM